MTLFLDSSVVLAAYGRPAGSSHAIFDLAPAQGWRLIVGNYVVREMERNVQHRLEAAARAEWQLLRAALTVVADEFTHPWAVIFPASKDKPVLFTAAAVADVLLTLDRADFGSVMTVGFYGLAVMKPGDFLRRERATGRLRP